MLSLWGYFLLIQDFSPKASGIVHYVFRGRRDHGRGYEAVRLGFLERVVLYEVNRLACFTNEYKELDGLYEDNVSQKISDARFAKMSQRMDVDTFLETVRRYTNATEITQRMVAELIDHIDVYHAEKQDGVTTQHITIYYNCIGTFSVPDRRKIPAEEITMGTRKGVAVSYSRSRIAV